MAAKALAPVLAKQLGSKLKAAYLVPDYTYGTSVYNSMKEFTEKRGWTTVNEQLAPLGTTDFSSYLLKSPTVAPMSSSTSRSAPTPPPPPNRLTASVSCRR